MGVDSLSPTIGELWGEKLYAVTRSQQMATLESLYALWLIYPQIIYPSTK